MAVWQFEVALEPREPTTDPNNGASEAALGRPCGREDSDVLRKIDSMLPRRESWSEDLVFWGEEDGDRVHAALDGGEIVELTARIDLRRPPGAFPSQLVELARYCGVRFSTADGERIPADVRSLSAAARRSEAFRFVLDPCGYFSELVGKPAI